MAHSSWGQARAPMLWLKCWIPSQSVLTFRKHHTLKGDTHLHGEDLLSISKWAAMQNKGHSTVVWSLLGCLSKLGSKIGTIHHVGTWKIIEFTPRKCIHGTRCKWLFNKGIQKSAVNAGSARCAKPKWGNRRGEGVRKGEKTTPSNYQAHHLRAIWWPFILHMKCEIFKQAYILKGSADGLIVKMSPAEAAGGEVGGNYLHLSIHYCKSLNFLWMYLWVMCVHWHHYNICVLL